MFVKSHPLQLCKVFAILSFNILKNKPIRKLLLKHMKNKFQFYPLIIIGLVLILINSCKKKINPPVLTTSEITAISSNNANSGGNITSDGGATIISCGVCWGTVTDPSISDNKTTDGADVSSFVSNISGLTANTTYYLRAYASNSAGIAYGNTLTFKTGPAHIPDLMTSPINTVTGNSAVCGGNISYFGGTPGICGVCWSTGPMPTTADNKTLSNISNTGSFTSKLTGLIANTTYYVRAYATNPDGTGYGNIISFKTQNTVSDIDGNQYHLITIGTQIWMGENMLTTRYRNGDPIANIIDNSAWLNLTTGAYCNYNNDSVNATTYGRLYNWYTLNDSRNIAPIGWHVATDADWVTLNTYLIDEDLAGGKLKEAGSAHWLSPNSSTNEVNFTALPGGSRKSDGTFSSINESGYWWSATEQSPTDAWDVQMWYLKSFNHHGTGKKGIGISVRCVKD
jgi:uncharacterized protein (TIGR02145 family)